jgi:hypothetical protein
MTVLPTQIMVMIIKSILQVGLLSVTESWCRSVNSLYKRCNAWYGTRPFSPCIRDDLDGEIQTNESARYEERKQGLAVSQVPLARCLFGPPNAGEWLRNTLDRSVVMLDDQSIG